jgi:type VI secretion system protein ImpK
LHGEEERGILTVTEKGSVSIVTLPSVNLFASGSATINPAIEPTLMRIATELNKLPGPVQVIGHTDDQPLRVLSYANNAELSRERAMNVVRVLQRTLTDVSRLSAIGRGSDEPVAGPPFDLASRARNRRVEIRHQPGF